MVRREFWDNKILSWEYDKYDRPAGVMDVNSSLKFRRKLLLELLLPHVKGKSIVELGCGSATLAKTFIDAGAFQYTGIDVSQVAIANARRLNKGIQKAHFIEADFHSLEALNADICFSLGFLDWIGLEEISSIKNKINSEIFCHSFSEKRLHPFRIMHAAYVYAFYGHKNTAYIPRYYSERQMRNAFNGDLTFLRNRKLSFGCMFHNISERQ